MIPNPILKVLETLQKHRLRYLLMGGQACVLYGAAEFSRDTDILIYADQDSLSALDSAMKELQAEVIAVPPFEKKYLDQGLAVHFRCQALDVEDMRLDAMSVMRGVEPFSVVWERRTTIEYEGGLSLEVLDIQDLVQAKKTRRDKDWPMIRRLVESHYAESYQEPTEQQIKFWLQESRTPAILIELANQFPFQCAAATQGRPALRLAKAATESELIAALEAEEKAERAADEAYWKPLMSQIHELRRQARDK